MISRVFPALVLAAAVAVPRAQSLSPQWSSFGLPETKVFDLSFHDGSLYAATTVGLYRRSLAPAGGGWTQLLSDKILRTALPLSEDTILVSVAPGITGDPYAAGIFRTTDGGTSWYRFQGGFQTFENVPLWPNALLESPSSNDLFATGPAVIVRSTDRGAAWTTVWGDVDYIGMGTHFVTFSPSDPSIVWSGGEAAMLSPYLTKSTDGGANWTLAPIHAGGDNACYDLAVDYTNPAVAYVGMEGRIMKTSDGGANWDSVYAPPLYPYFFGMETTPSDPDLVYAVGASNTTGDDPLVLHLSPNGGQDWETYAALGVPDAGALDMLLVSDGAHDTLYIATVIGVYRCHFEDETRLLPRSGSADFGNLSGRTTVRNSGNTVRVSFRIQAPRSCRLIILDQTGRVAAMSNATAAYGDDLVFHITPRLAPGIYHYRLVSANQRMTSGTLMQR